MALLNGKIPDTMLVSVGVDAYGRPARFRSDAAASWNRAVAAGMPTANALTVSDTYRDYARQVEYRKNPPNGAGLAAVPGTSQHGWGLAVDTRGQLLRWMTAHGAPYGFIRTIPSENWHFEYVAARDTHSKDTTTSTPTPEPVLVSVTPSYPSIAVQKETENMTGYITALYQRYLNRNPSAADQLYWVKVAEDNRLDLRGLEAAFLRSAAGADAVLAAYQEYLGRKPSTADVTFWTTGRNIGQVFQGISTSAEATKR